MSRPLKVVNRVNTIPIQIPKASFSKVEKFILMFLWNLREPHRVKTILKKKNKGRRFLPPDLETYYKATVIKTV
jgi:hypothetical protein